MSNFLNTQHSIVELADVFKALANPSRLQIFQRLLQCCPPGQSCCSSLCVGDLGRELAIAPSTVSHHIRELRLAGLIRLERRGQSKFLELAPGIIQKLGDFFRLAGSDSHEAEDG